METGSSSRNEMNLMALNRTIVGWKQQVLKAIGEAERL
mgnify:CR=1 FL=1